MMIRLIPILHVISEHNIDYKTVLNFKRFLLDEIYHTGQLIERCLPFMKKK
ncbi:hypothetical protein HY745_12470 [Candidatus Desantisbacteria bacterium]|nr:hypothetical protein [Candidatus Desantisbacteria bacterium]